MPIASQGPAVCEVMQSRSVEKNTLEFREAETSRSASDVSLLPHAITVPMYTVSRRLGKL